MRARKKEVVLLTGASGSMGFEAFRLLWGMRKRYDIVLLLRPSRRNRIKFKPYEHQAGIVAEPDASIAPDVERAVAGEKSISGNARVARGNGLKIVWGDALNRGDIWEACRGIDWCLHCMALISPAADRDPEMAALVNTRATGYIVDAIQHQDPEHIKMIYVGSVAMYGDRLPPVHVGRVGDPLLPSFCDTYAISKIRGELAVMESKIVHTASLRQTFIMIPDLFSLMDPIMFHQPINSFMETITARDAGRALVGCLDIGDDSDFWGSCYNISGGPGCRATYLEFLNRIYRMLGVDYRRAMKREWFALRNFHMQFYEDSGILNGYLHHWDEGEDLEDYYRDVWRALPWYLHLVAWLNKRVKPFRRLVEYAIRMQLRSVAMRKDGTLWWIRRGDESMIRAFYGSMEEFRSILGWDVDMPDLDHRQGYRRLDHGYDESKEVPDQGELIAAAQFRGGSLISNDWNGDMFTSLRWECSRGHVFEMTPNSILRCGHWCMECITPPQDYREIARLNRFAAQVLSTWSAG